jgi:hypothetical protein
VEALRQNTLGHDPKSLKRSQRIRHIPMACHPSPFAMLTITKSTKCPLGCLAGGGEVMLAG